MARTFAKECVGRDRDRKERNGKPGWQAIESVDCRDEARRKRRGEEMAENELSGG